MDHHQNNHESSSEGEFEREPNNNYVEDLNLEDLNVKITLKSSARKDQS